ncbi:hypothetical protein OUZ56_013018 [Daphnia magna]|uniref:Uncharacterized protein n=1 Tax=Daphnia magna TaxID=35525 RepID=A0ABQ9Z5H1_9CRUS|nr:hypothetical protein OUZ56_013018 [Daphnia magna]
MMFHLFCLCFRTGKHYANWYVLSGYNRVKRNGLWLYTYRATDTNEGLREITSELEITWKCGLQQFVVDIQLIAPCGLAIHKLNGRLTDVHRSS